MREAFELAWNITYLFCGHRPQFLSVDHMYFYEPVEITRARALMVEVTAEVIDPASGITEVTNVSYFTFNVLDKAGNSLKINQVLPESYEEGLKYLDGYKRFRLGEENEKII